MCCSIFKVSAESRLDLLAFLFFLWCCLRVQWEMRKMNDWTPPNFKRIRVAVIPLQNRGSQTMTRVWLVAWKPLGSGAEVIPSCLLFPLLRPNTKHRSNFSEQPSSLWVSTTESTWDEDGWGNAVSLSTPTSWERAKLRTVLGAALAPMVKIILLSKRVVHEQSEFRNPSLKLTRKIKYH